MNTKKIFISRTSKTLDLCSIEYEIGKSAHFEITEKLLTILKDGRKISLLKEENNKTAHSSEHIVITYFYKISLHYCPLIRKKRNI